MNMETRQDFIDLMHRILDPLKPYYSQGKARVNLGDFGVTYFEQCIGFEGFSRPLWALAPYWAGKESDSEFEEIYTKGLANGTDPNSKEYWGGFVDYDQRFVEMAAIANALIIAPEKTYDKLSEAEKNNLVSWLSNINNYAIPDCNWQFFMILVNIALKKLKLPYSEQKLQECLEKIESYYIGDGWYQDGTSCQKDYYISFAIHYYGLLYSKHMHYEDPARSRLFKERAIIFAKDFIYWFDDDGAAIPFGRSLTYKWAQNSFWAACIYAEVYPYPIEVIKGILTRNFEYWLKQKIFDRTGILHVGYAYPNLIMSERYNSACSSYWSMKSFIILALPKEHEFWFAKAQAMPLLDKVKPLPHADMIIQRFKNDTVMLTAGVCELYGHGHVSEKYAKFAYSAKLGFSCPRSTRVNYEAAPDSMLAFIIDDNVFVRKNSTKWHVGRDEIVSHWSPFKGINVVTTLKATSNGHIRHHEVESDIECEAQDYGFCVPQFDVDDVNKTVTSTTAKAENAGISCEVSGDETATGADVLKANPNTNLLFTNTNIPYISYKINRGKTSFKTKITVEISD